MDANIIFKSLEGFLKNPEAIETILKANPFLVIILGFLVAIPFVLVKTLQQLDPKHQFIIILIFLGLCFSAIIPSLHYINSNALAATLSSNSEVSRFTVNLNELASISRLASTDTDKRAERINIPVEIPPPQKVVGYTAVSNKLAKAFLSNEPAKTINALKKQVESAQKEALSSLPNSNEAQSLLAANQATVQNAEVISILGSKEDKQRALRSIPAVVQIYSGKESEKTKIKDLLLAQSGDFNTFTIVEYPSKYEREINALWCGVGQEKEALNVAKLLLQNNVQLKTVQGYRSTSPNSNSKVLQLGWDGDASSKEISLDTINCNLR
jgi:hypothetical protein